MLLFLPSLCCCIYPVLKMSLLLLFLVAWCWTLKMNNVGDSQCSRGFCLLFFSQYNPFYWGLFFISLFYCCCTFQLKNFLFNSIVHAYFTGIMKIRMGDNQSCVIRLQLLDVWRIFVDDVSKNEFWDPLLPICCKYSINNYFLIDLLQNINP